MLGALERLANRILSLNYRGNLANPLKKLEKALSNIIERSQKAWEIAMEEFGGEADHVHLMLEMHPNIIPSKFVNNLKTVSSRLICKVFNEHLNKYYWQKPVLWTSAYCLITAGSAPLDALKAYIQKQERPQA
jgi:putative transposase